MSARWLLDAAEGDGGALSRLQRHTVDLFEARRHPLHIASVVTSVLAGWDGCYPDEVFDAPELFDRVAHGSHLPVPLPPGVLAAVPTATKFGDLYGEVVCSHLDPDDDDYDDAGTLLIDTSLRRRAVVAFDCMPAAIQPDDPVALDRIRRQQVWLSELGHVTYRAPDDDVDDLERYCRWLAHPHRSSVRGPLPDSTAQLRTIIATLADELAGYRSTFATYGRWLWLREEYEALLGAPAGRLNRVELRRTLDLLAATYGSGPVRRTVAHELAALADGWDDEDREPLTVSTGWIASLFTVNAYVAERLSDGAPVVETRDGPVKLEAEPTWGLAGLWHVDPLTDDEVEQLRAAARAVAEDRAVAAAGRELVAAAPYPFTTHLTLDEFETGRVTLPREVLDRVADGPVTVRLAFVPPGRFAARPVAVASSGRPDEQGRMPLEWPALLPVGTRLDGHVRRRGRIVELTPAWTPLAASGSFSTPPAASSPAAPSSTTLSWSPAPATSSWSPGSTGSVAR